MTSMLDELDAMSEEKHMEICHKADELQKKNLGRMRVKLKLFKRKQEKKEDPYALLQTISVTDVKGYLQKEFDRAKEREEMIEDLHQKIIELEETKVKYEAMLVVQEKTQERIERQDGIIKKLRAEAEKQKDVELKLRAKIVDVKANAEKKIKELKSGAKKK